MYGIVGLVEHNLVALHLHHAIAVCLHVNLCIPIICSAPPSRHLYAQSRHWQADAGTKIQIIQLSQARLLFVDREFRALEDSVLTDICLELLELPELFVSS